MDQKFHVQTINETSETRFQWDYDTFEEAKDRFEYESAEAGKMVAKMQVQGYPTKVIVQIKEGTKIRHKLTFNALNKE